MCQSIFSIIIRSQIYIKTIEKVIAKLNNNKKKKQTEKSQSQKLFNRIKEILILSKFIMLNIIKKHHA